MNQNFRQRKASGRMFLVRIAGRQLCSCYPTGGVCSIIIVPRTKTADARCAARLGTALRKKSVEI